MAKRLYVGNLGYAVTSKEVQTLFESCGPVKLVQIVTDRDTGGSRGFAFVEMSDTADADLAIERIDGQEYEGRRLNVFEARPKSPTAGRAPRP
jgi:cold-inducible RNA-binding protein